MSALDGLLLIDKPAGPTSHDVIATVRRVLGVRRAGHAGTLDPAARGLLPVVLGRATRLVGYLVHSPKAYRGTLELGVSTDTDDLDGAVLARHTGAPPAAERVIEAARAFLGQTLQVPPAYSARKVAGHRLHRLARRGILVTAPAQEIEVSRFELRPGDGPATWAFVAEVSSGTYIRGLARDLGRALGCGGALATLVRTRIGPMRLDQAVALPDREDPAARDQLVQGLLPLESMPLAASVCRLDDPEQARRFVHGQAAALPAPLHEAHAEAGVVQVLHPQGALLGMGLVREGRIHPRVVLGPA